MSYVDGGDSDPEYAPDYVTDGGDAFSTFFPYSSTATYWSVDGNSLQTHAFDIESIGGSRLAPPPLRGDDIIIPHSPGEMWIPKQVGARTINLSMWVVGVNEDGTIPSGPSAMSFDENFRKLRQLLWTPRRRFTLTKNFYSDGVLKRASALGEYAGGLSPNMTGRTRGLFDVDIRLADPYFYGPEVHTTLLTGTQTVTLDGDDISRCVKFHVDGPRKNVKIRNVTLDVDVEYYADLSSGDTVDIDVKNFSSTTDPSGTAPYNSTGAIRHSGDDFWFLLQPGVNTIQVTSTSGIGAVTMTHREVYL